MVTETPAHPTAIFRGGPLDGHQQPLPSVRTIRWDDFDQHDRPRTIRYIRTGRREGDHEVFEFADG